MRTPESIHEHRSPDAPSCSSGGGSHLFDFRALRTDISGMPMEWIGYETAVRLYCLRQVAYVSGAPLYRVSGGVYARSGERTFIEVNSIIATQGHHQALIKRRPQYIPPLNNTTLFQRDAHLCMYTHRE